MRHLHHATLMISLVTATGCHSVGPGPEPGPPAVACASSTDCYSGFECTSGACLFPGTPVLGKAVALAFTTRPADVALGANLDAFDVVFVDSHQNIVAPETDTVVIGLSGNPDTVALQGLVSLQSADSHFTFSSLTIPAAGEYTLSATAGALHGESATFKVHAPAWTVRPPNTPAVVGSSSAGTPTLWFFSGNQILPSQDGGVTLGTPITAHSLAVYAVTQDPFNASNLASLARDSIALSHDGGQTWAPVSVPAAASVQFDPAHANRVYVVDQSNVPWRSDDGGTTFVRAYTGSLSGSSWMRTLLITSDGTLFGLQDSHVVRSQDGGQTWAALNPNVPNIDASFAALGADTSQPGTLFLPTLYSQYSADQAHAMDVYISTDAGGTWHSMGFQTAPMLSVPMFTTCTGGGQTVLYATTSADHRAIIRSTDHGATWTEASWGLSTLRYASIVCDPADPNHVYVSSDGMWETHTGGL